jgi:hypothetical protein
MKKLLLLLLLYSNRLTAQLITIDDLEYSVIATLPHLDSVLSSKGFSYLNTETKKDWKTINWSFNLSAGQKANAFFEKTVFNNTHVTPLVLVQLASQSDFDFLKNSIHGKGYINTQNYIDSFGSLNFEYKSKNFKVSFSKSRIKKGEQNSASTVSIVFSEERENRIKARISKKPNIINISKLIGLSLDSFAIMTNKLSLIRDTLESQTVIRFTNDYNFFDFYVFENVINEVKITTDIAPMLAVFCSDIEQFGFDVLSKKDEQSGQLEDIYKDFYNHKIVRRISHIDHQNNYIKITRL